MTLPKRLIEVDLPIRRISAHAQREKPITHGHLSTLHVWWARRPLTACRAVLCALLWPDPADENCPEAFVAVARKEMLAWTTHERLVKLSAPSQQRFNAARKDSSRFDDREELRMALLDFIADFANWDSSKDAEYLATSRLLTQQAHEALGGAAHSVPMVLDSFAGGGSIPLEALRIGADAFASDLNPIPGLLNKIALEYVPRYGQQLADEVRGWGQRLGEDAEAVLGRFYPKDKDGSIPMAYLWARTIVSENPAGGKVPVEVPLIRSLWLSKKGGNFKALRWQRDAKGGVKCATAMVTYANGESIKVRRPLLEIFSPVGEQEIESGTVARGSATCPVTNYTTPVAAVRRQIQARDGGTGDARLFCVVTTKPGQTGRNYRLPTKADHEIAYQAHAELKQRVEASSSAVSMIPDEPTPRGGGSGAGRAFSQRIYGMDKFSDLFSPRQLLALTALVQLNGQAGEAIRKATQDSGLAEAIAVGLAAAINSHADGNSSLCGWRPTSVDIGHTFGRQVIPMLWDFAEACPFSGASRDWQSAMTGVLKAFQSMASSAQAGQAQQASADEHPLPDDIAQCFFSDPPYYDAVPYADLSDFFYVWFKRTLRNVLPALFADELAPKDDECILDEVKGKDRDYFEQMMGKAMAEGRRILAPDGIGCVVFAHKSTSGWEAQLQAMVDAGWTITASWPIDTEMGSRLRAMNSAALASSIHLVVRPRMVSGKDAVGDWRDVVDALPKRISAWLPRLAEEGVVGADAIFACLGPALEIFSRYDKVEKASGEPVTLREYLEQVWAEVAKAALSTVVADADLSGFEADAMLSAMWLWTVAAETGGDAAGNGSEDEASAVPTVFKLEYDTARKIAQGLGVDLTALASIVAVTGDTATLLPVAKRTEYLFGKGVTEPAAAAASKRKDQFELFAEKGEDMPSEPTREAQPVGKPGETTLDRVHQAMLLFAGEGGDSLKRFLVDDGAGQDPNLWKLAQALSALYPRGTDEKRWVDGVLARKKTLGL